MSNIDINENVVILHYFLDPKKGKAESKAAQQQSVSSSSGGQPNQEVRQQPRSQPQPPVSQQNPPVAQGKGRGKLPQQTQQKPQQTNPQTQAQAQAQGQRPQLQGAWTQDHKQKPIEQSQGPEQSQCAWGGLQKSEASSAGTKALQKPVKALEMSPKDTENLDGMFVEYKGAGKRGRSLGPIETNYLKLCNDKMVENVYHYDVENTPQKVKKLFAKVFLEFARTKFPTVTIAFDGKKSAYASEQLKIDNLNNEISVLHPETGKEYTYHVSIQAANDCKIPIKKALMR